MDKEDYIYLVLLHCIGISQKKLNLIFGNNQNYKIFYEKLNSKILIGYNFSINKSLFILSNKIKIDINKIKLKLSKREVHIITIFDKKYPSFLRNIPNPPYFFYLRGLINNSPKIAVVGSRKISNYGETVIKKIIPNLSKYFCIVSGGAFGCDSLSHKECLNAGNTTISILGTGIDIDYPIKNKNLYNDIVKKGGGIISIFPIGEVGNSYNFPIRNEIVAGISNGVLIIEAGIKSGTIITANLALDLGKDLFVVPGNIFNNNSLGANNLIKNGCAKLITNSQDILEEYNILHFNTNQKRKIIFNDFLEEKIYNILLLENNNINELSKKLQINISLLLSKLGIMEINNYIEKSNGGKYKVK